MNKLNQHLNKLRQLCQIDVKESWQHYIGDLDNIEQLSTDLSLVTLNEKGYITWSAGCQVCWLIQSFTIPRHLQDYPLEGFSVRLSLSWWAEDVKIYINGELVQEGDLFDSSTRLLLTPLATEGDSFTVAMRLVSSGHDIGALMRSILIFEDYQGVDPGFIADELTILCQYLECFESEQLAMVEKAIASLDWNKVNQAKIFNSQLLKLYTKLKPLGETIKHRRFHLLGHAHLDMAWLWTVDETWKAAQRTFTSVLSLQQDFCDLIFCHTSPALYEWIETHRPDLFERILAAYHAGKWEILGGMWIEPDANLIAGESLIRQLLYGQRYIKEKFGQITQIAWLPDSFGFTWQLPQILKQSGINYFVTGKLHWNDTTKFPYGAFWWRSPDETEILTLMSPPNVAGVMDTNPLVMTNYAIDWEKQTGYQDIFWLPGVGDHGGGPTRDMLEVKQRWDQSAFFPKIQFNTALNYLKTLETNKNSFPVWEDELYLELHRGCYTTHADQKGYNRRCEELLYQAELWSAIATIQLGKENYSYPKQDLESAWKKVLFNQFHDILPGTSIPDVFIEANQTWESAKQTASEILSQALDAIAAQIHLPSSPHPDAKPMIVFNSLNWCRSEVVTIDTDQPNWTVCSDKRQIILSQITSEGKLCFLVNDIPSIGYRLFWLVPQLRQQTEAKRDATEEFMIENETLRVRIHPQTGDIESLYDKINHKEVLNGYGNQLQGFTDQGQYWDAWNIDPHYEQHPLPPSQLKSIEILDKGIIQSRIRVIRTIGCSEFIQDYILQTQSPLLKITTTVHWQETHVMVKAAFPLTIENNVTSYEIPCGVINRSNCPKNDAEKAKWEVSAHHWADLSNNKQNYGVSLLNDGKYGYDSKPHQLRLTLLRSPKWTDPNADRGYHHFTYAIYPHRGNWQAAKTVRYGYALNIPLQMAIAPETGAKSFLPHKSEFVKLNAENLILMALKSAEDDSERWIVRCYESEGKPAKLRLEGDLNLKLKQVVNCLEESAEVIKGEIEVKPWKIISFLAE